MGTFAAAARWLAVSALLSVLLLACGAAQARPDKQFVLGAGAASRSVSGDLDGRRYYYSDPTVGPYVYVGEPDDGAGGLLMGAVQANENVAIELLAIGTEHDATHTHPDLAGQTFTADIFTLLAAGRFGLNFGDAFDVFARIGAGPMSLTYEKNTVLPGSPLRQDSTFSGFAFAAGAGFAVYLDPFGFELGLLRQEGRLDNLSAAGDHGEISSLDVTLNTVTLIVTVHFGDP